MSVIDSLRDGRIGRFPIWAVGVAIAGAIILFVIIRNRMRENSGDAEAGAPGEGEPDNVEGIPDQSFADSIGGNFPSYQGPGLSGPRKPVTNAQWLILAFDYLVGNGEDPGKIQKALQDYLAGKVLTAEQQQVVNLALANSNISLPPEGVTLSNPNPNNPAPDPVKPQYVAAPTGTNLYSWSDQYGGFTKLFGFFKGDPSALNPTHRNYMIWTGSGTKIPTFKAGTPNVKVY